MLILYIIMAGLVAPVLLVFFALYAIYTIVREILYGKR